VAIESREGQLIAVVQGQYPDNCSQLGRPSQAIEGNIISVTLPLAPSAAETGCEQVATPFTIQLQLDITSLTPGDYALTINGVEAGFTLQ
jgi:hypothetical protein